MVFKRQSAEQGDFLFDGHPAETGDIRNLTGNGRPENKRNAQKDIRTELQIDIFKDIWICSGWSSILPTKG